MTAARIKRIAAGEYNVSDGERTVTISRHDHLGDTPWVARAEWDMHLYSDPMWTLREAKAEAFAMLND